MNDHVSEYVARLVAAAPPVSPEVRAKLADILRAVVSNPVKAKER